MTRRPAPGSEARDAADDSPTRESRSYAARSPDGDLLQYMVRVPKKIESPYVSVFLHGQIERAQYRTPVFLRQETSLSLNAVCLFASDPVLERSPDCSIGWYLSGARHFWPLLDRVAADLARQHRLRGVVWHGPSSGGYAAIRMALQSRSPSLALAIAPQNDPRSFFLWPEFAPWAHLPGTAEPEKLSTLLARRPPDTGKMVYAAVSDRDLLHLKNHLLPIVEATDPDPGVYVSLLRNGRGHGKISHADYWAAYRHGIALWERNRDTATGRQQ
ncbi:hypothetical protein CU254_42230 (plasmid) [Amycolatopsis sp. AA4]|uniref:hypothetical protein n=1 Tax=Actinomycetes TaxID=1760 RepID=UPI0001B566D5|nr:MULTISPECIES: hypothetical protein [Actinomycetes]ATY17190.1 hypothetical protein CU254_42230 [Amycolatopsis sp. AA4]EFL12570.1 hypothetical protein SSMG_08241 [Streptomyces sp. AA4]